ncbi:MAG: acetyltransferase [Gammaproteobacteria bacterium]
MADVVIFGLNANSRLAHYYLCGDSPHQPVAFTAHREYLGEGKTLCGLPVVPFEDIEQHYPPGQVKFIAPLTAIEMNRVRARVFLEIKEKGYGFISYISSHATVLTGDIGENCFILEDNTIQPFVKIGDNTILWSGNHIGHHSTIGNNVFIASHAVVSGFCNLGDNTFVGVNATIRDGISVGEGAFIAMAASLAQDAEPWCAYAGVPANKLEKPSTDMTIYHAVE